MRNVLSERIAEMRKRRNVTLKELGQRIGVSEATMHRYEAGHTQRLTHSMIQALADALNCSPVYLMGWTRDVHFDQNKPGARDDDIAQKYGALDMPGQRAVDAVLNVEYERVMQSKAASAEPVKVRPIRRFPLPVSAGSGIDLSADNTEDAVYIPLDSTSAQADFVVKVAGDSMEPEFRDGDLLLVQSTPEIAVGQYGIFSLNGDAYFKKYEEGRLVSLNSKKYDPIQLSETDAMTVFGRVLGITHVAQTC